MSVLKASKNGLKEYEVAVSVGGQIRKATVLLKSPPKEGQMVMAKIDGVRVQAIVVGW